MDAGHPLGGQQARRAELWDNVWHAHVEGKVCVGHHQLPEAPPPPLMPPPISAGSGWRKRKAQKYDDISIGAELKGKVMKPPPSAG